MKLPPFATEHFFARYEFNTPYQLCNSDCETISVGDLLEMADISLDQMGALGLGYTESQGNPHLREVLSSGYANVTPEDVVVLGSPVEGIYLTARALLEPGDEVIVLSPAYDALINLFEHVVGAENVRKWRFRATPAGWQLDLADLQSLLSPRTKLVVVNFPH
ncbi:MAG: aminotransferase class I/II-fold pyridoxal phosphate-dependent enzyme, partial [Caldilineaceae bacterium]|nr:aminotransferase class I/II-fold pyridoxal phosphate-dependent enzyme [Caldilineaceae bacterium]